MCRICDKYMTCYEYIRLNKKEREIMEKTKKENKQVSFDLGDTIGKMEEQIAKGFKGTITDVSPITSDLFYKDTSGRYETRNGVAVTVKMDDGTEFSSFFSIPNLRGYEQSNMFLFKKMYKSVPLVGQSVDCIIDESGFFRIKM